MLPLLARYRTLLSRIDSWFRRVAALFPTKVSCHLGCSDCCLGLFDVTPLDVALLREGLKGLPSAVREDIRERAWAVNAQLAVVEPWLRGRARLRPPGASAGQATLAGLSDAELDAVIDTMGPVRCPVLGPDGACRLYEHRPMVCRLNGVPVVDTRGRVIQREGCFKNALQVGDAPPSVIGIDHAALRREEERLLAELGEGNDGRFIAQAVACADDVPADLGSVGRLPI